jgi:thymidylate synthase ThyX
MGWSGPESLLFYIQEWITKKYNYTPSIIRLKDTKYLYRLCITNPEIGKSVCSEMLKNFKFPYGNPNKTTRMIEHINHDINFAQWGSEKFNIIIPNWFKIEQSSWIWIEAMDKAEQSYNQLIKNGWQPQQSRIVLPQSLKTEIICTANPREWIHIFKLRTSKAADPQMREIMIPLLKEFQTRCPVIFNQVEIKD